MPGVRETVLTGNPKQMFCMGILWERDCLDKEYKIKDLTGNKYGKLKVLKFSHTDKNQGRYWLCQCDCGNIKAINEKRMKSGMTRSCGCLHKEVIREKHLIHGERKTKLYQTWVNMKNRCYNSKIECYSRYGGKGIKVCPEWHTYINFSNWAKKNGYREGLTIERIDPQKDYCPENCEWITFSENCRRAGQKSCWGRNLATGEYVEFTNIKDFSEKNGFSRKCIDRVLHGKNKTHKGWVFGYL